MRNLKKMLAVAAASVMTLAMSVSAFATTTIHFQNADGWSEVGAWVYEGVGFTTNVSQAYVYCDAANHDGTAKPLWPGAKCVDEGNGWVKTDVEFTDLSKGVVMIFNNFVADDAINETTEQCDLDAVRNAGLKLASSYPKLETSKVIMNKKDPAFTNGIPSEIFVSYNGTEVKGYATAAEAGYTAPTSGSTDNGSTTTTTPAPGTTTQNADGSTSVVNADGTTTTTAADGTVTVTKGSTTSTSTVKTGDTVAVSLIVLAVAAAAVVVATKKRVNA